MDVGVTVVTDPGTAVAALLFVFAGVALGTVSGLVPGLHANNFALLLAAAVPVVPGPPRFVGAAMLAAGVVHTFLDVVPALALGVPDAAMAATAIPGHRLVIQGRGREALRLSALGSGLAIALAVPLALPVTAVMSRVYPALEPHLSLVLAAIAVLLVVGERSWRARLGAALAVGASGLLGLATLDLETGGLAAGGTLAPLFAGLFGAPVLVEALGGDGVPPQADAAVTVGKRALASTALVGTLSGAIVGYVSGVSSGVAATGALAVLPGRGPRAYVVVTSGVNTANTVLCDWLWLQCKHYPQPVPRGNYGARGRASGVVRGGCVRTNRYNILSRPAPALSLKKLFPRRERDYTSSPPTAAMSIPMSVVGTAKATTIATTYFTDVTSVSGVGFWRCWRNAPTAPGRCGSAARMPPTTPNTPNAVTISVHGLP